MMRRWALFLSGRGSTAGAALDHLGEADIRLVVSSRKSAVGLKRARRSGVPTLALEKDIDWVALSAELNARGINAIFLLGFMRLVPESFLAEWSGRIWNLHPSLLPDFSGARALERALESRSELGASIHDVIVEMDAGQVRLQKKFPWDYTSDDAREERPEIGFSAHEQGLVRQFLLSNSMRGCLS